MKLSSKFTLLSRFVMNLANLYLIGYLMMNSYLTIRLISLFMFGYLLFNTAVMVIYIQWRISTQWKQEWTDEDERTYR